MIPPFECCSGTLGSSRRQAMPAPSQKQVASEWFTTLAGSSAACESYAAPRRQPIECVNFRRARMTDIRPVTAGDRAQWDTLWAGYLRFYRRHLPADVTDGTFSRLIDPKAALHGLVAVRDGALVGFVHYLFHPTTWSLRDNCYLEDLYVDPATRGGGAGRALIHAVYADADRAQAAEVYWMTQEFNAEGRALYDTLARRTSFIRYER
jgi:GNAT superfamily N-acetyltransferase